MQDQQQFSLASQYNWSTNLPNLGCFPPSSYSHLFCSLYVTCFKNILTRSLSVLFNYTKIYVDIILALYIEDYSIIEIKISL